MSTNTQVLIIGYVWVEPTSSAAGSRMLQLINLFLENNYEVTFASPAQKGENAFDLSQMGVTETEIVLNSSSFDAFIQELNPNIVVFDRFMMEEQFGWRVVENCPNAIRILDTEDLHFLRKVRYTQLKNAEEFSDIALLKSDEAKREIASILRCDLSLIISSYEMRLLKDVFRIDESILLYLPFLLDVIDESKQEAWLPYEEREDFVFVGNFFHKPNVDAVLELKRMWRGIRERLPKVNIHIYGAYVSQQIQQLHKPDQGFILHGYTSDVIEKVSKAKVVLAPLRFGAGIKGKLTEAMICGTPSVTTAIGAEGMRDEFPWNGFVEDDLNAFADLAIKLYTEKEIWLQAQNNGVKIINTIYDKTILGNKFTEKLNYLQNEIESHRNANFLGSLLQYQTLQATKYMSKWIEEKNKPTS
ncbi:glycosyltransferase [uncultured Tenacibaculum sp.]|uniref:glycosyltransferase n=1 Tax=uncultured Tenacibaculum sp. TaxID=174713 RepID=UPI002637404E|nr:glycosyltransferase [uncultured Tenacibaculum sp.]